MTATRVVKSSGSAALDQEMLDLVRRAQPFPAPPAAMLGAQIDLTVPIRFNMQGGSANAAIFGSRRNRMRTGTRLYLDADFHILIELAQH